MTAVERIKQVASEVADAQPRDDFGHGFLWVRLRNGHKFIATYILGRDNHGLILDRVRAETGVESAWINLD